MSGSNDWEDQEETIVSFAPTRPEGPDAKRPPGESEDDIATIIVPKRPAPDSSFANRTVVAGGQQAPEGIAQLAWLVITGGGSAPRGKIFPLDRLRTEIGRGPEAAISVADDKIGRAHAAVKYESGETGGFHFVLYDLASTNGTFVNGQRIVSATPLNDGDRIRLGDTEFAFKLV